jgi:hypothetical protein
MNRHTDLEFILPDAVSITRPGRWGNRFVIGVHGSREEVIEMFRRELWSRIRSGNISLPELADLHGKQLVCVCHPKPCHGHVLEAAAAWAASKLAQKEHP